MKDRYYYAYILNPEEIITNGYQKREKIGCVLIDNGEELKELFTNASFLKVKENEVIDGKRLFENNISLIGIIDKEITMEDVVNFIHKSEIDKTEYVNLLIKLIGNTRKKAIEDTKNYYQLEETFTKEINKNRIK